MINPQRHELEKSDINLIVASSLQGVGNYRDNYGGYALKGSHWNTSHAFIYNLLQIYKKKFVLTYSQMELLYMYILYTVGAGFISPQAYDKTLLLKYYL